MVDNNKQYKSNTNTNQFSCKAAILKINYFQITNYYSAHRKRSHAFGQ